MTESASEPHPADHVILDTSTLQKGDLLDVIQGDSVLAHVEILDSHDPSSQVSLDSLGAKARRPLGEHHHLLVQTVGDGGILPAGLFVGERGADLIFTHATLKQGRNPNLVDRMIRMRDTLRMGGAALRVSQNSTPLSVLPEAQQFLDDHGELRR